MPSEHGMDGSKDSIQYLRDVLRYRSDPVAFMTEVLGVTLFPMQEQTIREFYRNKYDPRLSAYRNFYYQAGMRSGKTAEASMMGCYEFFDVVHLPDPAANWGLLNKQLISLSCIAASERQVQDGIFYNLTTMLQNSEWFNTWFDLTFRSNDIFCEAKDCKIRTLPANANTSVGRSNKCVMFDELDLFLGIDGGAAEAWNIFNRVKKSTDTFGIDGHTIAISSPKQVNGIISTLYERGQMLDSAGMKYEPYTYSVMKTSWEANPHLTEEELRAEYRFDMDTFYRDFACQPAAAGGLTFPEGVILNRKPFNVFENIETHRSSYPHVIAFDPAAKNDSFGAACGYIDPVLNLIVIDGVTKFRATDTPYVKPSDVRKFLRTAVRNLNGYAFVFDAWMYVDVVECADQELGLYWEKHIVDKEDYDRWRAFQEEGLVDVIYDDFLKVEVEALTNVQLATKVRVDHPARGSKDMADCVANVIWYLTEYAGGLTIPRNIVIRAI